MADIFLSYSSKDKERAILFVKLFEQQGWSVWWDHKIRIGTRFDEIIQAEISSSKCVVVLWSHNSVKSHWVKDEANEGQKRGILAPVLIDAVDIPLGFRSFEAANLSDWQGDTKHPEFVLLRQAISDILQTPSVKSDELKTADKIEQIKTEREKELIKNVSLGQKISQFIKENRKIVITSSALFLLLFVMLTIFLRNRSSDAAVNSNQGSNTAVLNSNIIVQNMNNTPPDENKIEPDNTQVNPEIVSIPLEERVKAIVNIFEEGRPKGRYPYILNFGDGNIFQYGHSGADLKKGTLYELIKAYCESPNAKFKDKFQRYLSRLQSKDTTLASDPKFIELLKSAGGEDPVMLQVQNKEYDKIFWQPSLNKIQALNIKTPLGMTAIHECLVLMGDGEFEKTKNETRDRFEGTPAIGIDERQWIKAFLEIRKKRLLSRTNPLAKQSVWRVEELLKLVREDNWELKAPLTIQTFVITD